MNDNYKIIAPNFWTKYFKSNEKERLNHLNTVSKNILNIALATKNLDDISSFIDKLLQDFLTYLKEEVSTFTNDVLRSIIDYLNYLDKNKEGKYENRNR